MYRMILVPCLISCSANSPCPAMRDGPTRTRIFTSGCLLVDAEVLPVLSSFDSTASNIVHLRDDARIFLGECQRGSRGDGSGIRLVYSILILFSSQVSAHCCCPSPRILIVYICS